MTLYYYRDQLGIECPALSGAADANGVRAELAGTIREFVRVVPRDEWDAETDRIARARALFWDPVRTAQMGNVLASLRRAMAV